MNIFVWYGHDTSRCTWKFAFLTTGEFCTYMNTFGKIVASNSKHYPGCVLAFVIVKAKNSQICNVSCKKIEEGSRLISGAKLHSKNGLRGSSTDSLDWMTSQCSLQVTRAQNYRQLRFEGSLNSKSNMLWKKLPTFEINQCPGLFVYAVRAIERVPAGSCHFSCLTDPSQSVVSFPCVRK